MVGVWSLVHALRPLTDARLLFRAGQAILQGSRVARVAVFVSSEAAMRTMLPLALAAAAPALAAAVSSPHLMGRGPRRAVALACAIAALTPITVLLHLLYYPADATPKEVPFDAGRWIAKGEALLTGAGGVAFLGALWPVAKAQCPRNLLIRGAIVGCLASVALAAIAGALCVGTPYCLSSA